MTLTLTPILTSSPTPARVLTLALTPTQVRAVELFNEAPCLVHLALKPCCLPGLAFVERGDTFELGGHATLTTTPTLTLTLTLTLTPYPYP